MATNAAAAIYNRVLAACSCTDTLTPEALLAAPAGALRAAGLSERKAGYMADLARHFSDGRLSDDKIGAMEEAELEEALCAVKGIGLCAWCSARPLRSQPSCTAASHEGIVLLTRCSSCCCRSAGTCHMVGKKGGLAFPWSWLKAGLA